MHPVQERVNTLGIEQIYLCLNTENLLLGDTELAYLYECTG